MLTESTNDAHKVSNHRRIWDQELGRLQSFRAMDFRHGKHRGRETSKRLPMEREFKLDGCSVASFMMYVQLSIVACADTWQRSSWAQGYQRAGTRFPNTFICVSAGNCEMWFLASKQIRNQCSPGSFLDDKPWPRMAQGAVCGQDSILQDRGSNP